MIPLHEAEAFVLEHCGVLPARSVGLDQALGLVVASDVVATEPVPPFANSAMDGYALRTLGRRPLHAEICC